MRSPIRLRIPSDSPVSSDSSTVSPRVSTTGAVGDQLVAGLDPDDVAGDDLVGAQLDHAAVADRLRPRRDQQRELVERLLRLQLLADPDRRVDDRDQAEERVGPQPEREDEDEEAADDRVEQRQDVGGDDARHRAAVRRLGLAQPREPALAPRRSTVPGRRSPQPPLTRLDLIDDQVWRRVGRIRSGRGDQCRDASVLRHATAGQRGRRLGDASSSSGRSDVDAPRRRARSVPRHAVHGEQPPSAGRLRERHRRPAPRSTIGA